MNEMIINRASKNLLIQSLDVYMLIQRYGNFEVAKKDISNTDFNIRYTPFKDCISDVKDIVDKLTLLIKSYEMENSILKKIGKEKMLSCVNSYLKEKDLEELDIRDNILEICISQYVPNDLTAEQKMYIDEGVLL
ncbi:MAG: hypothetical protein IJC76_08850 [Lachnospiraceae bacterium]|nr:hypothetical protein [Lachnospiraceae bacterium]